VFNHFLRDYEATVAAKQPLDYCQQKYRDKISATKAAYAGKMSQRLLVL
jgi:hypothetical protein